MGINVAANGRHRGHDEHDGAHRLYVEGRGPEDFDTLPHTELPVVVEPISLEEIFVAMVRRALEENPTTAGVFR